MTVGSIFECLDDRVAMQLSDAGHVRIYQFLSWSQVQSDIDGENAMIFMVIRFMKVAIGALLKRMETAGHVQTSNQLASDVGPTMTIC